MKSALTILIALAIMTGFAGCMRTTNDNPVYTPSVADPAAEIDQYDVGDPDMALTR